MLYFVLCSLLSLHFTSFFVLQAFSFKMMIKSVNLPTAGRGHKGGCYICISWGKIKVLRKEKRLFICFVSNELISFIYQKESVCWNKQTNKWLAVVSHSNHCHSLVKLWSYESFMNLKWIIFSVSFSVFHFQCFIFSE